MSSRFFRSTYSDSDDDDSAEKSEEVEKEVVGITLDSESDEDVEVKRVVRSKKDKRVDAMVTTVNQLKNHMNINDWLAIQADFDALNKQLESVVKEESVPLIYLRAVVSLEEFIQKSQDKEGKKKMSTTNAKALNTMKQKLRKNNKSFEEQIEAWRKAPDAKDQWDRIAARLAKASGDDFEGDDDGGDPFASDGEEDDGAGAKKKTKKKAASKKKKKGGDDDDDDDDDDGDDDDGDDDDGDDMSGDDKDDFEVAPTSRSRKRKSEAAAAAAAKAAEEAKPLTQEEVDTRLAEVLNQRGKKSTDRTMQVDKLKHLVPFCVGAQNQLKVLLHVIAAHFDVSQNTVTSHIATPLWQQAVRYIDQVLHILDSDQTIVLHEEVEEDKGLSVAAAVASRESDDRLISGNLVAFIERLDDEFIKSLQIIDPHTEDYVKRLQDEPSFLDVATRTQRHYESIKSFSSAARIASRRIEHIYHKREHYVHTAEHKATLLAKSEEAVVVASAAAASPTPVTTSTEEKASRKVVDALAQREKVDLDSQMQELTSFVFKYGSDRLKMRALLCAIFHDALQGRYYEAREKMLMSHMQDSIVHADIPTMILYNRTMVQLGLAAFQKGLIVEAHNCLTEICGGSRVKELLAQGLSKFGDTKTQEQEQQEKKRQMPFHMHINMDLLEAVHLTSAMLLEVPNMAASTYDPRRRLISRAFRRLMDYWERNTFNGPPETTRDFVIAAAKALQKGYLWRKADQLIQSLKVWALLPDPESVKAMIRSQLQEEGLRVYLLTYGQRFESMNVGQLCAMFDFTEKQVHSLVSKMMINEEFNASWDQPSNSIVLHRADSSRLQYLAMQFADKATALLDANERVVDSRGSGGGSGGAFGYARDGKNQKEHRGGWGNQERSGNRTGGYTFNQRRNR